MTGLVMRFSAVAASLPPCRAAALRTVGSAM